MESKKLIFDIGFHKGEDTSYYLHSRYSVVGVDADPSMIQEAKTVFKKELDSGQLTLLNFAVSDSDDAIVELNISGWSYWNSLKKNIANRENKIQYSVKVATVRLDTLMRKYGVPYYCKIDVEGYDAIAASTLLKTDYRPEFISVETECTGQDEILTDEQALKTLDTLRELGYKEFKLVDQNSLEVLSLKPFYNVHGPERPHTFIQKMSNRFFRKPEKNISNIEQLNRDHNFKFHLYATGPFGNELNGNWFGYQEAKQMLLMHRKDFFKNKAAKKYSFWCDWHAKM